MHKIKKQAIIFDCDGTLVDTEYQINTAVARVLQSMGYEKYTPEYCNNLFYALNMDEAMEIIIHDLGTEFDYHEFIMQVNITMNDSVTKEVKTMPGVKEYLSILASTPGILKCVASNGEPTVVRQSLQTAGLIDFFGRDMIFTYKDVTIGKPAPDLFLHAANKMEVAPANCLVIEDSPIGATAAKAAGMDFVIISPTGTITAELSELKPHAIIKDMRELKNLV
jgi:HAD superfamily hydrolase (TIGR01509 family)